MPVAPLRTVLSTLAARIRILVTLAGGYKTVIMLNSAEHEILITHKYKISRNYAPLGLHINVKMPKLLAF